MLVGCATPPGGLTEIEDPIIFADRSLFPEGVAVDRAGGLYVSSLMQGSILYLEPESHTPRTFAAPGSNGLVTVVGLHVASDEKLLYACSSDPGYGKLTRSAKPAVTAFRLTDGAPAGRFELPAGGFCNDITEFSNGTILATDSFKPRIYSILKGSNQIGVWFEDKRFEGEGFNLNGIVATS
jgi:sugar lactone lactonase YvrE